MNSPEYTAAYNEVKALGGDGIRTPTVRTQEQTEIGATLAFDPSPEAMRASLALPTAESRHASARLTPRELTALPAVVPSACSYSAATQNFVCPPVTAGGLTIMASYTLYDAAGHTQSQADKNTTASIRLVSSATGTTAMPSGAVTGSLDEDATGPPSRVSSAIPASSASVVIVGLVAAVA